MTETAMLDLLLEAIDPPTGTVEGRLWEARSQLFEEMDESSLIEGDKTAAAFYGSATEMAPSLAVRGGWGLVLRRSESRYLNIHDAVVVTDSLYDHVSHFVLNDPIQGPPVGDASGLARALVNLAGDPIIREIAAGSRLDPASIRDMIQSVCSLLTVIDAPSAFHGSAISTAGRGRAGFVLESIPAGSASPNSPQEDSEAARIAAEADRLSEEFLFLPAAVEENPDISSAVEALMERHATRGLDEIDAWAEQLSEKLSRFTD